MPAIDLLLLNASNYPGYAVYPYAFVQVSAIARRHGVRVARFDFLDTPGSVRAKKLAALLTRYRPRMVGFHLRQADTVVEGDYRLPPEGDPSMYFLPVDDTADLIAATRALTDAPVVVGGFGFTVQPVRLARRLGVDFGVQGEPDGFFARFADVLARRRLATIENLIYRVGKGYRKNPRVFFSPAAEAEYTPEILDELTRFQRKHPGAEATRAHAPVEIARGCPMRCYFCQEPAVKGRKVRVRDWAAVETDLRALDQRGIRQVWLVCSEINADPNLAVVIARKMACLNRGRAPGRRFTWKSYNLPTTSRAHLARMIASGFVPGWNDFASFEDRNLRRCRVPYRAAQALAYCRAFQSLADRHGIEGEATRTFFLFLGNAFANARTVRETLRRVDEAGLSHVHDKASITMATRVFVDGRRFSCGNARTNFSRGRTGQIPLEVAAPTFHYPPALLKRLGSVAALRDFFTYIGSTFLSSSHRETKDFCSFLRDNAPGPRLAGFIAAAKTQGPMPRAMFEAAANSALAATVTGYLKKAWSNRNRATLAVFRRPSLPGRAEGFAANALLIQLMAPNAVGFARILRFLRIPCDKDGFNDLSEYAVAKILYRRFASTAALEAAVIDRFSLSPASLDFLQLRYFLFDNHVRIQPEYRSLLF